MMEYYKRALPLTVGTFFSLLCIISLIEFVRNLDVFDLSYTVDYLPFLALSIVSGFIGIPLFFYGLEKVAGKKANKAVKHRSASLHWTYFK